MYLDAIGTVTPVYTASITSEVMGLVTQVHYREGQLIRKGEPLIDIDPRPFRRNYCKPKALSSAIPTFWQKRRWTWNGTSKLGPRTGFQNKRSTTRKNSYCRMRAL